MKIPGYYSSGEFAKKAQVTVRTIRFYDKKNILRPSYITPSGARFYTDADFARLQQILLLKFLGFSLEDIREMTIGEADSHFLLNSLQVQKKLIQDRIEQMQLVESAIDSTVEALQDEQRIDWDQMLRLIHLTGMEQSLKTQYQDAGNINARIRLHQEFSVNKQGWFPWVFDQCGIARGKTSGIRILELGCGNGALWTENREKIPTDASILVTDISDGMVRDARRNIGAEDDRFLYASVDCHHIPYGEESFDLVIANHLLFYCEDIDRACQEIHRVLKPGGLFICSTYGPGHMKEITTLVQQFDSRIRLSGEPLYERFGLHNGEMMLKNFFGDRKRIDYEDAIWLDQAEPLLEYILSCHGNQNQYLLDRYGEFREFVERKVARGFQITKEAGVFCCRK